MNIHIADRERQIGGLTYFVTSLSDGAAYHDGPMIVQQLSHTAGDRATFHIGFAGTGQAVPLGPPPAPLGTVQSLASGKCLDLPGGRASDGTLPIQYDCHGGQNQQWAIEAAGDDSYRIVSRMSGKCIGTDRAGAGVAGRILQSPCGNSLGQLWAIERPATDTFCGTSPAASAWMCREHRSPTAPNPLSGAATAVPIRLGVSSRPLALESADSTCCK